MTIINEQTGLPALPPGQTWRVIENYDGYRGKRYVSVQIVTVMIEKFRDYIDFVLFQIPLNKWITKEKVNIHFSYPVWDPTSKKTGDGVELCVKAPDGENYHVLDPDRLTPERVREAAEYAVELKAIQDAARSLLGDYPPKSISVVN